MHVVERMIEAVAARFENVAEALPQDRQRSGVGPGLDRAAAEGIGPEIVDAVHLVGVLVAPDHRVDGLGLGGQELAPDIGRGVDQHGLALVLYQDRAARAAVAGVGRIGGAPLPCSVRAAEPRDASRRAAAQDGHPHAERSAFPNSLKKFAVVAASSSATLTALSSAT
jgi:hypothetical protein